MQTTQEVNPHPHIAPCVNMWNATFLFLFFFYFLCHLLNVGACVRHIAREGQVEWNCPQISFVWFHYVTCYTNSTASHFHVNIAKLRNITCTLLATDVILQSLEWCRNKVTIQRPIYLYLQHHEPLIKPVIKRCVVVPWSIWSPSRVPTA